jgi:hypothetical protein
MNIVRPSFMTKVRHVGRKRGMAPLLWKMAYLPRNIITKEGLGGDAESARISKLVGWGLLKKNGGVYYLEKEEQDSLLRLFHVERDESDEEEDWKMYTEFIPCLLCAVWDLVKKVQLGRALRMLNHWGVLYHYFPGRLPPLPHNVGQRVVVSGLNVFCTCIFLRLSLALAVNCGLLFGTVFIVCWTLRYSARQTDKMKRDIILTCLMAVMGSYYANKISLLARSFVWNKMMSWAKSRDE